MSHAGTSLYLFDFDDNIMFLGTKIFLKNTVSDETIEVSTTDFATIEPQLGTPGEWEDFAVFKGTYSNFRDIPADELRPGQKQHFVADVEAALDEGGEGWQAPAWKVFKYACDKQRPLSVITARGHSSETLAAGIRVLVDRGLIEREPLYNTIYPVGNDDVRRDELDDPELEEKTPELKRRAILASVDSSIPKYEAPLRFGMSDDDPSNVSLIIQAMAQAKLKHRDVRFFVVNTHLGQQVKLEVFPVDFPVTGHPESLLSDE